MTEEAVRRPPGTPCWVSLMVHGLAATQEFYGRLFGWEFSPGPQQLGPYVRGLLDGAEVAGIGQLPPDRHLDTAWTTYLATDDADATAETIRSCGGTVGSRTSRRAGRGSAGHGLRPDGGGVRDLAGLGAHRYGDRGRSRHPRVERAGDPRDVAVAKFYQAVFGYERRGGRLRGLRFRHAASGRETGGLGARRGQRTGARQGPALDDVLRGRRHRQPRRTS